MPQRICPICGLKVAQRAYGSGSGWYLGRHHPVPGGSPCPASEQDVGQFSKQRRPPKRFDRKTLAELQKYHAIAKVRLQTNGGEIFPVGTKFEIIQKHYGLRLRSIEDKPRSISRVSFGELDFEPIAAQTGKLVL